MTDLSKRNLTNTAQDVRARLHNLAADTDAADDLLNDGIYLRYLAISLDGLRAAIDQRIQELGSHDPQDFG